MFHNKFKKRGYKFLSYVVVFTTVLAWSFGPIAPSFIKVQPAKAVFTSIAQISGTQASTDGNKSSVIITFLGSQGDTLPNPSSQCTIGGQQKPCYQNAGTFVLNKGGSTYQTVAWVTRVDVLTEQQSDQMRLQIVWDGTTGSPVQPDTVNLQFSGAGPLASFTGESFNGNNFSVGCSGNCTGQQQQQGNPPQFSGGGPQSGQTDTPTWPMISINSDIALNSGTVTTDYVSLLQCTGTNDASSCPATTGSNLCTQVQLSGNTNISCNISYALSSATTYKFTITTGVQSSQSVAVASAVNRIFRTGSTEHGTMQSGGSVSYSYPQPGGMEVGKNIDIMVGFMQNMNRDGASDANYVNSLLNPANAILQTSSYGMGTGSNICASGGCTLAYNTDTDTLTVNPASDLSSNTEYNFTLKSNVTTDPNNAVGGTDGNSLGMDYIIYFITSSTTDTGGPTLTSTYPGTATSIAALGSAVERNDLSEVRISFSEPLNQATVTSNNVQFWKDSDSSATMNGAETVLSGVGIFYDSMSNSIVLTLNDYLDANYAFCTQIGTGITDVSGNAYGGSTRCFKAGTTDYEAADISAPIASYADADNNSIWIQFNEQISEVIGETAANYTVETFAQGQSSGAQVSFSATGVTFTYYSNEMGVQISGLSLTTNQQFKVTMNNITDRKGNAITANTVVQGIVQDAANTGGYIGGMADNQQWDMKEGFNYGEYWENPSYCNIFSMLTNSSTGMRCEFPTPVALTTGAKIQITMPSDFVISSVAKDTNAYDNNDLNSSGPGITTISNVSASGNVITLTLAHSGDPMQANNQLRFELTGITTGVAGEKTASAIIKDANGVKQGETLTFPPMIVSQGGSQSISGSVYKDTNNNDIKDSGEGLSGVTVFCDSMGGFMMTTGQTSTAGVMVGHVEATTNSSGSYTCSGLTDGQYGVGLMFDPTAFNNLTGGKQWQEVYLSGGASETTVDFPFVDLAASGSGAQDLAVSITSSASLNNEQIDVFCHSGGFNYEYSAPVMQVVTLNSSGAGSTTLKLMGGVTYDCGLGPHIEFANFSKGGPPPMPTFRFMPPMPQMVVVPANSAPSALTFNLMVAGETIAGTVTDGTNPIKGAFVHANPQGCFDSTTGATQNCFGGFTQSNSDGTFTLNVTPGTYEVGADAPGLPPSEGKEVTKLSGGTMYVNGAQANSVTIKLVKSSTTVAGQIQDESGNGLKYVHVNAEKVATNGTCAQFTPLGGWRDTPTDDSGNYTLYIGSGTWNVRAFNPTYGEIGCKTVVVSSSSLTGQNIKATAGNFYTISGTAPTGSFISAYGTNGGNNTAANNGEYQMKVKAGTYSVDCYMEGKGPCGRNENVNASSANQTVNFGATLATGTVNVTITGITDAFIDLRDATGQGVGVGKNNNGVYPVQLKAGTYTVRGGNPKYGDLCSNQSVTVIANQTASVTCTPPSALRSVSGRITDGTSNLSGTTVTLEDSNGRFIQSTSGAQSGTNNNLSVSNVPDGTYTLTATKKGYEEESTTATVSGGNLTLSSPVALTSISGTNGESVNATVQYSGSNYASDAIIVAEKSTGEMVIGELDKVTGQAQMDLTNGSWTLTAYGDNGTQSAESSVTISNGSLSGSAPTMTLSTAITGYTASNETESIIPKSGGLIQSDSIDGLSINIPSSTLSITDTTPGKVEIQTDPTVIGIDPGTNFNMVGSTGYEITPKDANGNENGTSLDGDAVTLTIPYTDAQVTAAGVTESKLMVASLNPDGSWETFPTTVDTTNNLLIAEVTHFSSFGIMGAVSTSSAGGGPLDTTRPAAPSSVRLVLNTNNTVTVTWTDPSDSDLNSIQILRGKDNIPVSGTPITTVAKGVKSYTDTDIASGSTYKYIVRSKDNTGNTSTGETEYSIVATAQTTSTSGGTTTTTPTTTTTTTPTTTTTTPTTTKTTPATPTTLTTPTVDARTAQIQRIQAAAPVILKGFDDAAKAMGVSRSTSSETEGMNLVKKIAKDVKTEVQNVIASFVSYGTTDTKSLGAGERAGVVNSFQSAFGKAPETQTDWEDVLKIAAGRWPSKTNATAESNAKELFKKIYKRDAVISNSNDNAAVTIISYGLRPSSRNLNSEKAAITTYKSIFKTAPTSASDWDTVRAIAYSGAKR